MSYGRTCKCWIIARHELGCNLQILLQSRHMLKRRLWLIVVYIPAEKFKRLNRLPEFGHVCDFFRRTYSLLEIDMGVLNIRGKYFLDRCVTKHGEIFIMWLWWARRTFIDVISRAQSHYEWSGAVIFANKTGRIHSLTVKRANSLNVPWLLGCIITPDSNWQMLTQTETSDFNWRKKTKAWMLQAILSKKSIIRLLSHSISWIINRIG